jgi:hypothetical protein
MQMSLNPAIKNGHITITIKYISTKGVNPDQRQAKTATSVAQPIAQPSE